MKVVGLTGGIGSGKTTVAKMFKDLGVPLYIADDRAKILMNESPAIKEKLLSLFGKNAYVDGRVNRPFLANAIFNDASLLQQMNAIVHPAVGADFSQWKAQQVSPYVLKEAAIIFENKLQDQYDFIITVAADLEQRMERVIKRDGSNREKILAIVKNQWTDAEKIALSDFVITNHDMDQTKDQVMIIHQRIMNIIGKNRTL